MKPPLVLPTQVHLRPLFREDVEEEVRRLVWERARRVLSGNSALRQHFDEVGLMELVLAIEEAFDVDIEPAEVEAAVTIDDLVALAGALVAAWPSDALLHGDAVPVGMGSDRDSAPPSVR